MKKIAVDLRLWSAGGIGTFLKEILNQLLKEEGYSFYFLGFDHEKDEIEKRFQPSIFRFISLKSGIYSIKEQFELPLSVPAVDIFWTPHFNVPFLPIKAKKRLVTINDVYHLAFYKQMSLKQKIYARCFYNIALYQADAVTTISHFSLKEIRRYCFAKPKKLEIVHNGINLERFADAKNENRFKRIKDKYCLPDKYLLAVGNLRPHKNLSRVALALENLLKERSDYHLVIVGRENGFRSEDTELKKLLDKPSLRQKVHLLGSLNDSDLPYLYGHAEAFIFPSLYEGFGFPPLEAMASGCPVIASTAASIPEICQEACLYIDPYNVKDIENAIRSLWENNELKSDLNKKGAEHIQRFSWHETAQKYKNIISELV